MKGKKISNYEFNFTNMLSDLPEMVDFALKKNKRFNTKNKNFTVDTVLAPDTGYWETGIQCENFNDGDWVIVEEYESGKMAQIGHKKWVEFMKTNPKKLTDIHIDEDFKTKL